MTKRRRLQVDLSNKEFEDLLVLKERMDRSCTEVARSGLRLLKLFFEYVDEGTQLQVVIDGKVKDLDIVIL